MFGPRSWKIDIFGPSLGKIGILGHGHWKFGEKVVSGVKVLEGLGKVIYLATVMGSLEKVLLNRALESLGIPYQQLLLMGRGGGVVSGAFGVLRCDLSLKTHRCFFLPVSNEADDSTGGCGLELEHQP